MDIKEELKKIKDNTPPDTLSIKGQDKEYNLFMSAGLRQTLATLVGSAENIELMTMNPMVQEQLQILALVERDAKGKPIEDIDEVTFDQFGLGCDASDELQVWITGHVSSLFMRGLCETLRQTQNFQGVNITTEIQGQVQSLSGLTD